MTTAGRPVGIAEIANAIAAVKTVSKLSPRERLRMIEIATAAPAMKRIWFVSFFSWTVSGVSTSSALWSMSEMWPTSVAIPVEVTTKLPAPRVTFVFMKTMSVRSPSGVSVDSTASTPFETGRLSPVRADSAISSVAADSSRPSAGTTSPASIETTSPGTSCSAGSCDELAAAAHARLDDHHLLERRDRFCGLALLAQAEHGVEERQEEQHEPGAELLQRIDAADPGDEQHDLHRVAVLADEGAPARLDRRTANLFGPYGREPRGGLGRGQPVRRVDTEAAR